MESPKSTLHDRLRSLVERTATNCARNQETIDSYLALSASNVRVKLASIQASNETQRRKTHHRNGSPSKRDGTPSADETTTITSSSGTVLSLDENDVDQVLQLIEALEARNGTLQNILRHREDEFQSIQTKFNELRALQCALDAIDEEEEAARLVERGTTPPSPEDRQQTIINTRHMTAATNAVASVTAKLCQREEEITLLNNLLEDLTREYDDQGKEIKELSKYNTSLSEQLSAKEEELRNDTRRWTKAEQTMLAAHNALIGERDALRSSALPEQIESLTKELNAAVKENSSATQLITTLQESHQQLVDESMVREQALADVEKRNEVLIEQLLARDLEFESTIQGLEDMRSALATANQANMKANFDLEQRYTLLCEQLTTRNDELREAQSEVSRWRKVLEGEVGVNVASELTTRNALLDEQLNARSDELQCALTRVKQLEDELELVSSIDAEGVTVATKGTGNKMSSASDEASSAVAVDKATTIQGASVSATAIGKKGIKVNNKKTDVSVGTKDAEKSRIGARIPVSKQPSSLRSRVSSSGTADKHDMDGTSATTSKQTENDAKQIQVAEQLKTATNELLQLKALQETWHSEKTTITETLSARELDVKQLSVALDDMRLEMARLTASLVAAEIEVHTLTLRSQQLESERTAREQAKNEVLSFLRQEIQVSSDEFALFKAASDKTVASLESQRDVDGTQISQLSQSFRRAQTEMEKLRLEHAKRIEEQDVMIKRERSEIESLTAQLAEVTNIKAFANTQLAQLKVDHAENAKRIAEQDEIVKRERCEIESLTKQLAEVTNNKALADAQLSQLQKEHAENMKLVAEHDEIVKREKYEIESLTKQLAEVINNKALTDIQLAQLQKEHAENAKLVTEHDERVRQGHSKELAQETRVAKLESQLLVLEKEHETHMLGCVKAMSSLQQEKATADDRIAEQDEMVKKGLFVIESLTIQLADVTNNKALADARIVQLENQWKTDGDALVKQTALVSSLEVRLQEKSNELNATTMKNTELIVTSAAKDQDIKISLEQAEKDRATIAALITNLTDLEVALKQANSALTAESNKTNDMAVSIALVEKQMASFKAQTIADSEIISQLKGNLTADQAKGNEERAVLQSNLAALKDVEDAQRKQIAELQLLLTQKEQSLSELDQKMINEAARNDGLMVLHEKAVVELEKLSTQFANANDMHSQTQRSADETISALQTQLAKSSNTVATFELQINELTATKASMSASIGVFEVEGKKSSETINLLTESIKTLTAAKATADGEVNDLTARSQKAEENAADCTKRLAQLEAALNQSINDTSTLQRSYDELMASTGATAAEYRSERDELRLQIQSKVDEIIASKQHFADLEDQLKKAINECSMSAQTVASLEESLKNAAEELALLESKSNNIFSDAKLAADVEIQALKVECKSSKESIISMESRIADMELMHKQDDDDIRILAAAKMAADARVNDFESIAEKAKDVIEALHQRISELESQRNSSDDRTNALTTQLNDAILAKAVADERITELESRCEMNALLLGTMEAKAVAETNKMTDTLTTAQNEMQLLKEVISAKKSELAGIREASVALSSAKGAELVALNDRLSEASTARLATEQEMEALKIQSHQDREELKSLKERVSGLEGALKQSNDENAVLSRQLMDATALSAAATLAAAKKTEELETQCKNVQDEVFALQQREQVLEAALAVERDQLLAMTANHNNLTTSSAEESATLKREITVWTQKCNNVALVKETEGQRMVQLEGQIAAGTKDYAALKNKFDALHAAMESADVRIAQLTEQGKNDAVTLDALQTQIGAWKTAIAINEKCKADLEATLVSSGEEISALKLKEQESANEISALKQLADSCQMEVGTLNAAIASHERQKLAGEETIASLTQQLEDCKTKLLATTDEASERIGVLEGQSKAYEADISLLKKLLEDQKSATASVHAQHQSLKESSAAAIGVLETKSKTDDAAVASLRIQAKLDSEKIASLTDEVKSLVNQFQTIKSDSEQTIAVLQSKAKIDNTEIANLRALNATDRETIASLTQQLSDANQREKLLAQESQFEKETSAATIGELKLKGKRHDDEREALKSQLSILQTSSSQTIADLQALLKKGHDEFTDLVSTHANLTTAKAAADQEIEVARKQAVEDSRIHETELSRMRQALADAEMSLMSLRIEHLSSEAKHAEDCSRHEATVGAQRSKIAELKEMLIAASQQAAVATVAATVSSSTSTSHLPSQGYDPSSSHPHALYDDGFQSFDSDPVIITDLSVFNTDPGQDPETVLHMLIKIKMEYALVCSELDRARNEISRVKRISLINAQPIEPLRRKTTGTSEAKKNTRGHGIASVDASTTRRPAGGTSSFSSDMLKSTADLLRIKAKSRRNGSGSATGSMAGSMVSFSASLFGGLGGGSRANTSIHGSQDGELDRSTDNWEISSQISAASTAKAPLPPVPHFISTPK